MKKLKKQVLGVICLAVVTAMTTIAYVIPSPEASAVEAITETIHVRVVDKYAEVIVNTAGDGEVFTDKVIDIEYDYGTAKEIIFELRNEDGELVSSWTKTPENDEEVGQDKFEIDFPDYGDYVLSWRASGAVPSLDSENSIKISYYPVKITFVEYDEDGQPIFDIQYSNEADLKDIQIYDNDGKALFEPTIRIPSSDERYKQISSSEEPTSIYSKKTRIKVIMPDGAQTGKYKIGIAGNTASGELLYKYKYKSSTHVIDFSYTSPDNPDVPNTGSFLTNLNIAKTDFLITGLLIFFSAAIIALFIINKKRTR